MKSVIIADPPANTKCIACGNTKGERQNWRPMWAVYAYYKDVVWACSDICEMRKAWVVEKIEKHAPMALIEPENTDLDLRKRIERRRMASYPGLGPFTGSVFARMDEMREQKNNPPDDVA